MQFITNYVDRGLALVPAIFRKPVFEAVIRAAAEQVQLAEDVAASLYFGAMLDTAEGPFLDRIGVVLNASRGSLNDEGYRRVLRAFRVANASEGTRESIIETVAAITGAARVTVFERWPAGIQIHLSSRYIGAEAMRLLPLLLERVVGSGITILETTGADGEDGEYFGWSDDPSPDARGFDEAPWVERVATAP